MEALKRWSCWRIWRVNEVFLIPLVNLQLLYMAF